MCVSGRGHVGVSAQFVQANLHVCAIECNECVVCLPFTMLPPSPLHSNSVKNTHPTEPAVSCLVQESQKKMIMSTETFLPVTYCTCVETLLHPSMLNASSTLVFSVEFVSVQTYV